MATKETVTKKELQQALEKLKAEILRDIAAIHRSVKEFKETAGAETAELRRIVESQTRALGLLGGRSGPIPPKTKPH